MITGIHHVQLAAPQGSETVARKFYGELLGLLEIEKPPKLRARGGVWFELGDQHVHIGMESNFAPAPRAHPAFSVAGLDALAAKLNAAGHTPEWDNEFDGYQRFYIRDPFGNRLEFLEPVPLTE